MTLGIKYHYHTKYEYSISVMTPTISDESIQKRWDSAISSTMGYTIKKIKKLELTGTSPVYRITYLTHTKDNKEFRQLYTQIINNVNQSIMPMITSSIQNLKNKITNQKSLLSQINNKQNSDNDTLAIEEAKYIGYLNELQAISPKLKPMGNLSIIIIPAKSIIFVIILAILLSLIISLATVFIVNGIANIRDEIKQSLTKTGEHL